jgi:DNA-binding LacI/PurR family transcriptional regulator
MDHVVRDLPLLAVVDNSFDGSLAVTRRLLALGHRRIAYLDCYGREGNNPEKFAGYCGALAEYGLEVDDGLVAVPPSPELEVRSYVQESVGRLLELADPPTAVFCFDDQRALAAIRAVESFGLEVGRDIAVAGFGDGAFRKGLCSWLTSYRTYPRRMGREAVRLALTGAPRGESRTVIVPGRLCVRKSSCPPPSRTEESAFPVGTSQEE